jgi:hypothetical protein
LPTRNLLGLGGILKPGIFAGDDRQAILAVVSWLPKSKPLSPMPADLIEKGVPRYVAVHA